MAKLPETTASFEALNSSDLSPADREADLIDIRARWATRSQPTNYWWRYVAAAIMLGFIVWSITLYQASQHPTRLYAQYFDAQSNLQYMQVRGKNERNDLIDIEHALQTEQYHEALALSRSLTTNDPFDTQALLYQALAAMELQDFTIAAQALDQALALNMPTADRITAHWYRALVHLGNGEETAAYDTLKWVSENSQGQSGANAKALLKELDWE